MSLSGFRNAILAASLLTATEVLAEGAHITGVASVIDGDTIEIHGQRIRLFGIDAPESSQLCVRPNGERWRCGQRGSFALSDRIGRGTVICQPRDLDPYGPRRCHLFQGRRGPESLDGPERLGGRISAIFIGLRRRRRRCPAASYQYLVRRLRHAVGLARAEPHSMI
jgi:hypothetical protein